MDLSEKPYTGKDAEEALERAGITVNKNTVPNEKRSPFITSGIRIGTPAVTTRGFKETEIRQVGRWIARVLNEVQNTRLHQEIKNEVHSLCEKFPLYC